MHVHVCVGGMVGGLVCVCILTVEHNCYDCKLLKLKKFWEIQLKLKDWYRCCQHHGQNSDAA